ncbi:MAG: heavy-metal-associated domain-containing protein [Bacteroidetes bacterium]|nr:heavy-metal-associated domain-containing protein [Bacteroidota bacterium]
MSNPIIIKVDGMTCSNCARSVENAVADKGGSNISVNLADKEVVFDNPKNISLEEIAAEIERRGYTVIKDLPENNQNKKKS